MSARPCRFCVANHGEHADAEMCEFAHRDEPAVYELGRRLACLFQGEKNPTDEHVGWFLEDANAIVEDFGERPERWRVRKLPDDDGGEFVACFRVNDITYIIQNAEGHNLPERLAQYRSARASA